MSARGQTEWSDRLRAAVRAALTYPEIGASAGTLPARYRHVRRSREIGSGGAVFDAAAQRLLGWDVHRRAGLDVEATSPTATLGSTVVMRLSVGRVRLVFPCRVVLALDEPHRKGFAYGTLPGHPEVGEELFAVTRDDDDRVRVEVCAFSRPGTWWLRWGNQVGTRVQDWMTDRYVAAAAGPGEAGHPLHGRDV